MADINVSMPSENEDFDATTSAAPAETAVSTPAPAATEVAPAATEPAPAATEAVADSSTLAEAVPVETAAAPAVSEPVVASGSKVPRRLPVWPIITGLLVLAVLGLAFYAMGLSTDKKALEKKLAVADANPQLLVQKQTDTLIANVGKLMTLPKDETPTIADVSDAAKAKQQSAFFNNAQNGDRVLMYVKAGEAILYRPSTNKIILVAPLTFNNGPAAATSSAATTTKK